ncbi:MAG TPA: GNAT family N-acetyltransferase [Bradyrhizobium sp.]|nr:GNAT family N-acetyltransferase [Bradyrhizobium sp.]
MDMLVRLYDLPASDEMVDRLAAAGISIRRALPPEKHKVLDWVTASFSEAWANETDVAFSRQPVSCFIAIQDHHLLGFACHDATCRNFFGPTGVDPGARGKGIGAALLFACLEAMRHQGYGYAIIGGVGPADFYAKTVGAVPIEGSGPGIYRGLL